MIGERLAEIRKDHKDTQADLAAFLHVSTPTVRAWEQGKSCPAHEMLVRICQHYHTSADYLLGLSSDDPIFTAHLSVEGLSKSETQRVLEYISFLRWRKSEKNSGR